jgi:hypothetical protein
VASYRELTDRFDADAGFPYPEQTSGPMKQFTIPFGAGRRK